MLEEQHEEANANNDSGVKELPEFQPPGRTLPWEVKRTGRNRSWYYEHIHRNKLDLSRRY